MLDIVVKDIKDLTREEYKACYAANYGEWGTMRHWLVTASHFQENAPSKAIMIWNGPRTRNSNMIGWALLTPTVNNGYHPFSSYTRRKSKYMAEFWVKQQYRKQGHAKTLMAEVKKHDPLPYCIPHSDASGEFFSSYNITAGREERSWLKPKKPKVA